MSTVTAAATRTRTTTTTNASTVEHIYSLLGYNFPLPLDYISTHIALHSILIIVLSLFLFPFIRLLYVKWIYSKSQWSFVVESEKQRPSTLWNKILFLVQFLVTLFIIYRTFVFKLDDSVLQYWAHVSVVALLCLMLVPMAVASFAGLTADNNWSRNWNRFCLKFLLYPVSELLLLTVFHQWAPVDMVLYGYLLLLVLIHMGEYDSVLNPLTQSVWYCLFEFSVASPLIIAFYSRQDLLSAHEIYPEQFISKLSTMFLFILIATVRQLHMSQMGKASSEVNELMTLEEFLRTENDKEQMSLQEFLRRDRLRVNHPKWMSKKSEKEKDD
jgi:hypothetical protein